jgi:serine transporter
LLIIREEIAVDNIDKGWVLTCFGTAVGAGILFLPIQAGLGGIWPILFLSLIVFPITYISHRGITRIVASCPKEADIIGTVKYDLGDTAGFITSILYFLSIITVCVGYATGLTNIINSFLINQMHFTALPRPILTFIILASMTAVLLGGEKTMVTVTSILTFPLIALLFAMSIYMIPRWTFSSFHEHIVIRKIIKHIFLVLPLLIFAMNFSPICSSLGAFYRKQYHNSTIDAIKHSDSVIKWTSLLTSIFIMLFVFSLFFSTTPKILIDAKHNNIDALTAISLAYNAPIFQYVLPIISFLAIATSYFGHFAGTREGLSGIITQIAILKNPALKNNLNLKQIHLFSTALLFILLWLLAVYNPSILSIIEALSAPVIALYVYLMPVVLMQKIPRLRIYRSRVTIFIFIVGISAITGYYIGKII